MEKTGGLCVRDVAEAARIHIQGVTGGRWCAVVVEGRDWYEVKDLCCFRDACRAFGAERVWVSDGYEAEVLWEDGDSVPGIDLSGCAEGDVLVFRDAGKKPDVFLSYEWQDCLGAFAAVLKSGSTRNRRGGFFTGAGVLYPYDVVKVVRDGVVIMQRPPEED